MKLSLIFLAALVVLTNQQFQRTRGMLWMSPRQAITHYQPIYYDDIRENIPFFRHFSPSVPATDSLNDELYPDSTDLLDIQGDDYQSRNKGFGGYRPAYLNQPDARFFFLANNNNNANNNFNNPFFKTATFTLTSTVTVAAIQTCVPGDQLAGNPPPSCRRKRELADTSAESEDEQFSITPSQTQALVPTMSPSLSQMRYNRQLPIDEQIHYGIRSSKDEAALRETSVSGSVGQKIKEKRFFFNANANRFVVSTTVTSYWFINTVVTQTVSLGAAGTGGAGTGAVICLPVGYLVCPVVG